jgi:hypothetical protein
VNFYTVLCAKRNKLPGAGKEYSNGVYVKTKPVNPNQDFRRLLLDKLQIVRNGYITVVKQDGKVVQIDVCSKLMLSPGQEEPSGPSRDTVVLRSDSE